ncbi:flagellin [Pseudorhodobacter ferrugineus]|nr:flagellin [Pseudorhodobacter ferrugineus]
MAQTFMLRRMTTSLKQQANTAAQELTTGYSANIGQKLGGDLTRFSALESTLSRLKGYRFATDTAATTANAMQSVFGQIDSLTQDLGGALLTAANAENPQALQSLISDAGARFASVLAALNTKVGDKTLFAGIASDGPAVAGVDVILSALEADIAGAGASTAGDIEAAVQSWFDDPAGFEAVGYLGGPSAGSLSISAEDRVDLGFTAVDPVMRDTLKSLAMVALVGRGAVVPDSATGVQIVQIAGTSLFANQSDRTYRAADLGMQQARIEQAQTRNQAETSALELARSNLLAVDPYEAATRMEAAQTQLETLYSVTARLSRLRLVDFLR